MTVDQAPSTLQPELPVEQKAPPDADAQQPALETITQEESPFQQQIQNEHAYLEKTDGNKKYEGLRARYVDSRTQADHVATQVKRRSREAGYPIEPSESLKDLKFNEQTKGEIFDLIKIQIDALYNNPDVCVNSKKAESLRNEVSRYLDLLQQAQAEGDLGELDANTVKLLVAGNVASLAYQDRVASENTLGDHGIRHLVEHNIAVSEKIADELVRNGIQIKAIDRLLLHQGNIDHDIGYAMDPVRNGVNNGDFGVDRGHGVLAAQYIRQRAENPDDPLAKVFTPAQIQTLHEIILHHDSSDVSFSTENTEEARKQNVFAIEHVADNTHAFADKLPEILYGRPDTLKTMRLMKAAGEIGDAAMVEKLKADLVQQIDKASDLGSDDKIALKQAAQSLGPDSFKFTVPRICGNKPEFSFANGTLRITVQESTVHQMVLRQFGGEEYKQLKKFMEDLGANIEASIEDGMPVQTKNRALEIVPILRAEGEPSDYDNAIKELLTEPRLQSYVNADNIPAARQKVLQDLIKKGEKEGATEEEKNDASRAREQLPSVIEERRQLLDTYMKG